jgi:hypothetical protein
MLLVEFLKTLRSKPIDGHRHHVVCWVENFQNAKFIETFISNRYVNTAVFVMACRGLSTFSKKYRDTCCVVNYSAKLPILVQNTEIVTLIKKKSKKLAKMDSKEVLHALAGMGHIELAAECDVHLKKIKSWPVVLQMILCST